MLYNLTYTLKLAEREPSVYMAACMASTVVKCVVERFLTRYLQGKSRNGYRGTEGGHNYLCSHPPRLGLEFKR